MNTLAARRWRSAGLLGYVFVYTLWLKPLTPQNIVIGGAAGAVPPLVGWAAATGGLTLDALYPFAIVFLWTPPHFWALALARQGRLRSDRDPDASRSPAARRPHGARSSPTAWPWSRSRCCPISPACSAALYLVAALALGAGFIGLAPICSRAPRARRRSASTWPRSPTWRCCSRHGGGSGAPRLTGAHP